MLIIAYDEIPYSAWRYVNPHPPHRGVVLSRYLIALAYDIQHSLCLIFHLVTTIRRAFL